MKKVMVLSLVFLFYFNAPAHAGWINVLATVGEIVIKKIDSVVDDAIDSIGDLYNRVSKGPSESQLPSKPPNETGDLLGDITSQSCGEFCEFIVFQGGFRIFRIWRKKYENQSQSSCPDGFEHRRLQNVTETLIYQSPSQADKPLGYYGKRQIVCTEIEYSGPVTGSNPDGYNWYQSEEGWFLDTKTDETILNEYVLFERNISSLFPNHISCNNGGSFFAKVVEKIAVVYSTTEPADPDGIQGFYNKNETVCVVEERITNYPETWYRTEYGWAKKMDFKRLLE